MDHFLQEADCFVLQLIIALKILSKSNTNLVGSSSEKELREGQAAFPEPESGLVTSILSNHPAVLKCLTSAAHFIVQAGAGCHSTRHYGV